MKKKRGRHSEPKKDLPFSEALYIHYELFREQNSNATHILTTIRTRDGQEFHCVGMSVDMQPDTRCVMFHATARPSGHAFAVRDDDVTSAFFQVFEPQPEQQVTPFGFYKKQS